MSTLVFQKSWLTHPYLALAFRIYLGALFIYASMYKINYTAEFAETIASYQIIPFWAVNSMAIVLPWIELISGILLLAGLRTRSVALIIAFLLILFTAAIVINVLRGSDIGCGCFHSLEETMDWWTVLRDLIWFGMAIHVFYYDRAFQFERRFFRMVKEIP